MPIDLNNLDQQRQGWLPLGGALRGVEVLLNQSSPREAERFRQKLTRQGVLTSGKGGGFQINSGREDDFFRMFAEKYVLDWKGEITPKDAEYNAEQMGRLLGSSQSAFDQISSAISEDADFFERPSGG